ncbi:hypothetical protein C0992_011816 [Termitomyces sp. T32_za158]|nr:hypothetical protein C0992_011816 [Termitomyces sp. T32_za158]
MSHDQTLMDKLPSEANRHSFSLKSLMAQLTPSPRPIRTAPRPMSAYSSAQVPDSGWSSENFMLGAGMVIIQPSTHKLVLVYDTEHKHWFFPRGRKDIGESLETTVLREAYEESGYRATFLPLFTPTHAPSPPSDPAARIRPNTESLYTTITHWPARRGGRHVPGEYMTFWYAGQIPPDAVHETGTGMPDEQAYTSHIVTYEEAMNCLWGLERRVLEYVWTTYLYTLDIYKALETDRAEEVEDKDKTDRQNDDTACCLDGNSTGTIADSNVQDDLSSNFVTIVDSRVVQSHWSSE